jgi:hypothetical protein
LEHLLLTHCPGGELLGKTEPTKRKGIGSRDIRYVATYAAAAIAALGMTG